eukprot:CAMPEP_0196589162 /NCGR_PEP_ID=MMETSP1081-20130531/62862_1 /TAXON_ID=36882 /ORGANISM="Pyramimonas amylifera, Strain CCMP720" /LENGTH=428 /DNA_ID=CAMNT_0041911887 /DNA_START=63 /DNA_END=1349 /DNA_ORIENTATION=-
MSTVSANETLEKPQADSEDELVLAERLFQEGVQGIRDNTMEAAVEVLGKCLEIRTGRFGDAAPETASAYHKYGSALFYKAIEDSGVFGSKVPETVGNEDEDEDEDEEEDEEEDENENGKEEEKEDDKNGEDGKGKDKGKAEAEGESGAEEEMVSDMEMAWQMLETARVIYSNIPESSKSLSEIHERLADISMEEEKFEEAVKDYQISLDHINSCKETHRRAVLGVLFQLSMALQMQEEYIKAEAKSKEAIELCNGYIKHLCQDPDDQEAINEAKEMKGVLEDLNIKHEELAELAEQERSTKATMQAAFKTMLGPLKDASVTGPSSSASASSPFDAPMLATSLAGVPLTQVTNLGVVGRGRNRVTPVPVAGTILKEEAGGSGSNEKRPASRSLDDLMGGSSATIGFSSTPTQATEVQVAKRAKVSFADQ